MAGKRWFVEIAGFFAVRRIPWTSFSQKSFMAPYDIVIANQTICDTTGEHAEGRDVEDIGRTTKRVRCR